jgi:hypothetical protein
VQFFNHIEQITADLAFAPLVRRVVSDPLPSGRLRTTIAVPIHHNPFAGA